LPPTSGSTPLQILEVVARKLEDRFDISISTDDVPDGPARSAKVVDAGRRAHQRRDAGLMVVAARFQTRLPRRPAALNALTGSSARAGVEVDAIVTGRCKPRRSASPDRSPRWGSAGDLAAIIFGDPESFLTTLFGVSLAGVVPASLYPPAPASDLPAYLEPQVAVLRSCNAAPVINVVHVAAAHRVAARHVHRLECVCHSTGCRAPLSLAGETSAASDIAFVQFTSGSTAMPKGVVVTQEQPVRENRGVRRRARRTADDVPVSAAALSRQWASWGMAPARCTSARMRC